MNESARIEIMNFLASNVAVAVFAGTCIAVLLIEVVAYIRDKKSNQTKSIISPRAKLITGCVACLFVFSVFYRFHDAARETVSWRNDVIEKAASYTIYVDGIEVENENIDILSYSRKCVVIDDQAKKILIASTRKN